MGLNNATLSNGATYAAGEVGQAFSLDGFDDRAQVTDSVSLALAASLSIEGWVQVNAFPSGAHGEILFRGDGRGGLDPYSLSVEPNGTLNFLVTNQSNAGTSLAAPIALGQFIHVAGTLDDATGTMRLYENGVIAAQQVTTIRPFGPLDSNSNPGVGIGNMNPTGNGPFNGLIDELSVYNRALTSNEVLGIYQAGSDGKVLSPISVDFPSIVEGSTGTNTPLTFTIQRTGSLSGSLSVAYTTVDATATAGSDYVATSGSVTFADGEATKTIQVTVNGDNTPESPETFKLILTPEGQSSIEGLATIRNDDIGISVNNVSVTEGDTQVRSLGALVSPITSDDIYGIGGLAFGPDGNLYVGNASENEVWRYNAATGAFMGVFVASGSGGLAGLPDQSLIFRPDGKLYVASKDTSSVLRYDATTGAFLDTFVPPNSGGLQLVKGIAFGPDENLYLSSANTNQVLRYSGTTGAFLDVFVAAGSGGLSTPRALKFGPDGNLYVSSTGTNSVMCFDGTSGEFLSTFISSGSGGLIAPSEFMFFNGSVYVLSQNNSEVLRYDALTGAFIEAIPVYSDGLIDPTSMLLDFNNNLLVGTRGIIQRYGPASQAPFTVSLIAASDSPVTVDYSTADGTGAVGSDYVATSGVVTFAPGETTKTILVPTVDDTTLEPTETFAVNLSNAVGGIISDGQGVGTIVDDDGLAISISDALATEGGNTLTFLDHFVSPGSGGLSPANGSIFGPDGNLYIASGDTNSVLRYDGETGAFKDEFVTSGSGGLQKPLGLAFGPDGSLYVASFGTSEVLRYDGSDGAFLGTVVNGLSSPIGLTFGADGSLCIANYGTNEVLRYSTSGLSAFVTAGSGGLSQPRNAAFGPDGNLYVASQGTKQVLRYNGATGSFMDVFTTMPAVEAGVGPMWLEFGTDGDLYVTARDSTTSLNVSIVRFNAANGTFADRFPLGRDGWSFDLGPGNIVYDSNDARPGLVDRIGPSSLAGFTISLNEASVDPVTVDYSTADGSALAGSDYAATSGTVTFAPGETTKTILVQTVDNTAFELTEAFAVSLSNAVGATIVDSQGVGTIVDNDVENDPPSVTINQTASQPDPTGGGTVVFDVVFSEPVFGFDATKVDLTGSTAPGTVAAVAGTGSAYIVTVSGMTAGGAVVAAINPGVVTDLAGNPNLASTSTDNSVTYVNSGTVQFSAPAYSIDDAGAPTLTVTITRTGGAEGALDVDYAAADGTALAGINYSAASGTLHWAAGDSAGKTFTVDILDDGGPEADSAFTVNLSRVSLPGAIGTPAAATVNISEEAVLAFTGPTFKVDEGTTGFQVRVHRAFGNYGTVRVQYTVLAGTAAAGVDYTAPATGTLTWTEGGPADQFITFDFPNDLVSEGKETILLTLNTPGGNALLGAQSTTTVVIKPSDGMSIEADAKSPKATLTDGDGDLVTLTLGGKVGSLTYYRTDGGGGISEIDLTDTDPAKSVVTLAVKKPPGGTGNGRIRIGEVDGIDVTRPAGARLLSLAKADLVGEGVVGEGIRLNSFLGAIVIGDVQNGADITLGGAPPLKPLNAGTKITVRSLLGTGANPSDITFTDSKSRLAGLTAVSVGDGMISAASVGAITVKGQPQTKTTTAVPGDFNSDLVVNGTGVDPVKGKALASLKVAGAVTGAILRVNGNVGPVTVGSFVDSRLFARYAGDEVSGAFDPTATTIGPFVVRAKVDGFVRSFVFAASFKNVTLASAKTDNGDDPFGFVYKTSFVGLTLTTSTGKKFFNKNGSASQMIDDDLYVTKST
jgi:outer membrane protein assembly factor BamB